MVWISKVTVRVLINDIFLAFDEKDCLIKQN